jgi:DUF177 domain-containing protein
METENSFKLKFGSLSSGSHEFQYEMDADFFQRRSESLVKDGWVHVLLKVEKAERQLVLMFKLNGRVGSACDICLRELMYPVIYDGILHVKFTDKEIEDEAELIHLPSNTVEMNLADIIYDSIIISLPMRVECKNAVDPEECDPKVMNILNAIVEKENNPNPEWQKLKNLFNKN